LATAARQAIDDLTFEHYHEAMRDEADAETWNSFTLKAAKDGEFRDLMGEVWFPKLAMLREAYARSKVLPFVRPPLKREPWETDDDHDEYLAAVRANPKGASEGAIAYIVRIAETVASGRLAPAGKSMPAAREPGMEG
jgi:hypothetical protein